MVNDSGTTQGNYDEADFPLLVDVTKYLSALHSTEIHDNVVETFASGTILCEIFYDYIGIDLIEPYLKYAEAYSVQGDENLSKFREACEKIQIPPSCCVSSTDFRTGNYEKIELMLVLFTIRGMAKGLPTVPDDLCEELKKYKLGRYPESPSDRKKCEMILERYCNDENPETIPMTEPNTESSREEEMDIQALTDLLSSDSEDNGAKPEEISDGDNISSIAIE